MARQPAEPFLQLLKKAPVTLETSLSKSSATLAPDQQEAIVQPSSASSMSLSSEALAAWNSMGNVDSGASWGSDVTLIKDGQKGRQEASPFAEANPVHDIWSVLEQQASQSTGSQQNLQNAAPQLQANTNDINPLNYQPVQSLPSSVQPEEQSLDTWLPEPSASTASENNQQEAEVPLWDNSSAYDDFKEPILNGDIDATWPNGTSRGDSGIWGTTGNASGDSGIWGNSPKENAMPAPPAWLNMLTQSEIRQLNDEDVPSSSPAAEPVASTPPVQPARTTMPEVTAEPANDEEEAFSFGPEWLKSLGAAPIDDEASPAEVAPVSPLAPVVSQPLPAVPHYKSQPVAYEAPEEKPQLQPAYQNFTGSTGMVEQDMLTTLENLEANLFSQGFVPLEPNTLQTIAKTQEPTSPTVPLTHEETTSQEEAHQYDATPSLFANLESFVQEPVNASSVAGSSFNSAPMTSDAPFEEPSWLTSLNAVSTPFSLPERQQEIQTRQEEQIYANLASAQSSWESTYTPYEASSLSSVQEEVPQTPAIHFAQPTQSPSGISVWSQEKEPARGENNTVSPMAQSTWSQVNRPQEEVFAAQVPTSSAYQGTDVPLARQSNYDYLLNNELETTMKRPAVRLEPMGQVHDFTQNNRVSQPPRARMAEPPYAGRSSENNLSHQERLLKGYQHQLVGDYDEAMQEYRIIIRNSPELLGEVVSNVRALLKLAPKYSTGYRVLGDAYMRQGEYLQAMEAYNKALTMAKRAKS